MIFVNAAAFYGKSLSWNLNILSGPKFIIECGNCHCHFEKRLPMVNHPRVACTECGAINKLPLVYS